MNPAAPVDRLRHPPPHVLLAVGRDPRRGLFWTFTPLAGAGEALLHALQTLPLHPTTRREAGGRVVAFEQAPLLAARLREAKFALEWCSDLQIVDIPGAAADDTPPQGRTA